MGDVILGELKAAVALVCGDDVKWVKVPVAYHGHKYIVAQVPPECLERTVGALNANVPMLRRAGLRAIYDDGVVEFAVGSRVLYSARGVAEKMFGILSDRAEQLFVDLPHCPDVHMEDVTPAAALRNLRRVVREIDKNEGWEF